MSEKARREQATVLSLGARGKLRGRPFTLAGRTHVTSAGGGAWNEWTLAFEDDERAATLAETAAGFLLFTERPIAPPWDALAVGAPLVSDLVVTERGEAKRVASWGDVPDAPRTYRYADLSAPSGVVATLDYGSRSGAPLVFVGDPVRLADLGLRPRREPRTFLPAPTVAAPPGLETWLEVGDEGELATGEGTTTARFRVIGIVQRSAVSEGDRYTWEEYVLHAPAEGLRWLVVSDGHWNLVRSVPTGAVASTDDGARFDGRTFEPWSEGEARLAWATGELPWTAAIGDVVTTRDYVHVPDVLSCEAGEDEITWSLGTYVPPADVARAFGRRVLPKPAGRAPNQPRTPKRR
ncbi:MAG: hypothetical protein JWP97_1651 [Labilithrix sp.]|nr:hypothetical protein [Labilithrix sp.]